MQKTYDKADIAAVEKQIASLDRKVSLGRATLSDMQRLFKLRQKLASMVR